MPREKVTDAIGRRLITGQRMMLAQVHLEEGSHVPQHQHEHEQITYVIQGALRLWIGENREEVDVRAGEVLHIPSELPHEAEALERSVVVDIFSPPRQDWLDGTDDYLRKG